MNKFITLLLGAFVALLLGACSNPDSADRLEGQQTRKVTAEAAKSVGFPAIKNFHEKRLLKEIYERRDQANLGTFAYVQGMDGKLTCLGRAIGYGVPYSTQFSNPETDRYAVGDDHDSSLRRDFPMPQAEPNGLFNAEGMTATWLQLVAPNGDVQVVYVEPTIVVSPFELTGPAVAAGC